MPLLALDLVNPILTWAIRLAAAATTRCADVHHQYRAILCAAPSAVCPTAAQAAVLHLPFPYPDTQGAPLMTPVDRASVRGALHLLNVYAQLVGRHKVPRRYLPLHTCSALDNLLHNDNNAVSEAEEQQAMRVLTWWSDHTTGQGPLRVKVSNKLVDAASRRGSQAILAWCLQVASSNDLATLFKNAMDLASQYGHVDLLSWLIAHLPADRAALYSTNAMDWASQSGHVRVLDWWLHASGLPVKYTERAMDNAASTRVLDWWRASGLELRYSPAAMDGLACVEMLDWWRTSDLGGLPYAQPMERASAAGEVAVLDWWAQHVHPVCTPDVCLVDASAAGHVHVLQWWIETMPAKWGMQVRTDEEIGAYLCAAADEDRTAVVMWWLDRLTDEQHDTLMDLEYVGEWNVLEFATPKGNVAVLDAWKHRGLPVVPCSGWMLTVAAQQGHMHVLRWWYQELGHDAFTQLMLAKHTDITMWIKAGQGGHVAIIEWLLHLKTGGNAHTLSAHPTAVAWLVQGAIEGNQVGVLDWVRDRVQDANLFSVPAMAIDTFGLVDSASQLGHGAVLRWLAAHARTTGHTLQYSRSALVGATKRGHVDVLRWWMDESGLPLKFVLDEVLHVAIEFNQLWAWLFWIRHGDWRQVLAYEPTEEVVIGAKKHGIWDVLDWLTHEIGQGHEEK